MRARVSLVCSLLLLAACGEEVIGSVAADPDGGSGGSQADDLLAQYAHELEGKWRGNNDDRGVTFTFEFTASNLLSRTGALHGQVQVDCNIAEPFFFPLPVPPCDGPGERRRYPDPEEWDGEYFVLRLQGTDATISILPDPTQVDGFAPTCLYRPKPAPAQLTCGVTLAGFPINVTTFTRYSEP